MSESGEDQASAGPGQDRHRIDIRSRPADDFILSRWMRRFCLSAGVLVAYSQLAILAFPSFFRYLYPYQEHPDTYFGGYPVWGLPSTEARLGSIPLLSPKGTAIVLLGAALIALLGSIGLLVFANAKRTWRIPRWKLIIGSMIGGPMSIAVLLFAMLQDLWRSDYFRYDESYLRESYPFHGTLEYIGGIVLPFFLYPVLILWLISRKGRRALRHDTGSERS